jgi:hypothetical protein
MVASILLHLEMTQQKMIPFRGLKTWISVFDNRHATPKGNMIHVT